MKLLKKYDRLRIHVIRNPYYGYIYVVKQLCSFLWFKFYLSLRYKGEIFYFNELKSAEWFIEKYPNFKEIL